MINTIEECDEELARIASELRRLQLEREHVLNVRKFLEHPPAVIRPRTLTEKVLEVVAANPGISGISVFLTLQDGVITQRKVTFTLQNARKLGKIVNRGGRAQNAKWYIKEDNS